ncbi:hypothetical protein E2R66_27390 [Mucilaginibacter psychrotolerans]|uniref:Uncharacterized protein n=1 Tax=Mucilaginibacter psychrotolerans TaxID=1524096 RepID=A0A4Y8RYD3_9SPHI|nr:hypothetical protein E2R66_27390 [Mucilaginibacter psychrotolerans]
MFKPFNQPDSSITRKYGGNVRGQAICEHLVKLMGSRIRAESRH